MDFGGEPKTDRFPVLQQGPASEPRSQGLVPYVKGLAVVVIAVGASLYAVSRDDGKASETPPVTVVERTIIREVPVSHTRAKEAVQVEVIPSPEASSELPSMQTPSSVPESTSTAASASSPVTTPLATTSSEPTVVTVDQAPVETVPVESPVTQAVEQP